ncbi:MAG TPA: SAM-dependent methyltransferase, partial [Thermomicrobiales bacterium]|nr:SAM-dependent methyltransferase [Thermomicrobiales bacterium]
EVGENPYVHLGRQDITAHVDFTAVEAAAREAGFTVLGLTTQAEFVAGLGIERDLVEVLELARNPDEYLAARAAVMELLDPRGLGRFRVLVLAREIDPDIRLRGLSFQLRGSGGPRSV